MKTTYLHEEIPELSSDFLEEGHIKVGLDGTYDHSSALNIALGTVRLAATLGIETSATPKQDTLPYDKSHDRLVFPAPLISAAVNKKIAFLRGWKQFESCVKGFNAFGLMAEHIIREERRIKALTPAEASALKLQFLKSRKNPDEEPVFSSQELEQITDSELLEIDRHDLAIWSCFAVRTIFCSTSSNMGIAAHQALRLMQQVRRRFLNKTYTLLNSDEGSLVIWAPDERADFMNEEKTRFLQALIEEQPQITRLRSYVNRQRRDPGALKDALLAGGYFFPTNPQSKEEMQNLLYAAVKLIEKQEGLLFDRMLENTNVLWTLKTIHCRIADDRVIVERGVESGIYGMMTPYIIMLEELLSGDLGSGVCTWNQASIGAALAAAVFADHVLRNPTTLSDDVRSRFNSFFPALSGFLDAHRLGEDIQTRIHGVFDLANLQSLAQLLGVVVERHISGRGTAYVGLGSSSYANGNRCFEILKQSMTGGGAFAGKRAFHPATHTMNPVAQALIFGEDLHRYLKRFGNRTPLNDGIIAGARAHARKPEPAGAASLAGYLLTRLDAGTLSIIELAYVLKLVGFSKETFLEFAGHGGDAQGMNSFLQLAQEEGPGMGTFARNMLLLLDWDEKDLRLKMESEKQHSIDRYARSPLDDDTFEKLDGPTMIYLTGDNAVQPGEALACALVENCWKHREQLNRFVQTYCRYVPDREVVYHFAPMLLSS